jgi:glycosyltransferase involved in cell wall biosynthesis
MIGTTSNHGIGSAHSRDHAGIFLMTDSLAVGGTERQFVTLAQALDRSRFEISLGCLQRQGSFTNGLDEIAEFNLGGGFLTRTAHNARRRLVHHLRARGTAVVQSFDFYSSLTLIPAARWARVPVIIGSHRHLGDLLTPLQFAAQNAAFWLCDRVVCNSQAAANRLIDQSLPESKLVVIPNGLPREAFAESVHAAPSAHGKFRVGFIARMNNPAKNHAGFLRAAARLVSTFPAVEFVLVGDGFLRPGLERLALRLGLAEKVQFVGERPDVSAELASLHISVSFSSSESLSNVVLESMAAGVPVVATRVGGTPEVLCDGETGLLVAPGNEEELAAAMERLLTQPSIRVEFTRRALNLVKSKFRIESVARQYEELYAELLAEKGWRPRHRVASVRAMNSANDTLRISIVAPSTRKLGGQEVQADLLMRHWQGDPAVTPRFIPTDPLLPAWLRWVERIPYLRTVVRMPFYLAGLWRGTRDADIVHIFSASYWSFVLAPLPAWLTARLQGKKALINYRSGEARDHLRRWPSASQILRRVDRVVVPSGYLVDVFKEFGVRAQAVSNVVDLDQFHYRQRHPLRPRLLCPRGFHPYYSVDRVVRAFAQVQIHLPEAQLCLLGDGALKNQITQLVADLGLSGVEFTGVVSRKMIGRCYDRNDIFINASWLDNMPVSILEAFASGMPVVTTAPEGIRYLVEHQRTGLLCDPGDWQSLAENVARLLRDSDLASRLARNAFEESQRYRWQAVRAQWLEVYRSMCPQPEARQIELAACEELAAASMENA